MFEVKVTSLFFDCAAVASAVDAANRRALARAGAYVRTTARRSIRRKKGTAPPGSPPHAHEGSLKRLIYFSYDPRNDTVVIGPARFKKGEAPPLLEFGGTVRRAVGRRKLAMKYPARPFMGPALEKSAPALPTFWRKSVKGA